MRDDSADFGKTLRRLLERKVVRRAVERAQESSETVSVNFPGRTPRGDWDRWVVPGPEGIH